MKPVDKSHRSDSLIRFPEGLRDRGQGHIDKVHRGQGIIYRGQGPYYRQGTDDKGTHEQGTGDMGQGNKTDELCISFFKFQRSSFIFIVEK